MGDSEVLAQGSSIIVVNITRPGTPDSMIQYQCTASNGVESPAKAVANVTVHCKYQADWNFLCILLKNWSLVVTINVAKPQTQTVPNLINMRMCNILKIYLICFCELCIRSCRINMNLPDGYAHNRAFSSDYLEKHLTSSSLKFKYCMTCNVWYQMRSLFFLGEVPLPMDAAKGYFILRKVVLCHPSINNKFKYVLSFSSCQELSKHHLNPHLIFPYRPLVFNFLSSLLSGMLVKCSFLMLLL